MEYPILISTINDYIFCPVSIYFHGLYGSTVNTLYQEKRQINGSFTHKTIDAKRYVTKKNVLQSKDVYCEKYGIIGKLDIFDVGKKLLVERKKHVNKIYDGYIFQLYAQYFSLIEMGYEVDEIRIYSYDDNKNYKIALPNEDSEMLKKFEKTIECMKSFDILTYVPKDKNKCQNCIYVNICDRCLWYD